MMETKPLVVNESVVPSSSSRPLGLRILGNKSLSLNHEQPAYVGAVLSWHFAVVSLDVACTGFSAVDG